MKHLDSNWDEYTIKGHLRQVHYWLDRFAISRDVDHLDNAERSGDVVRSYLPICLQNLTIQGLYNLYLSFPSPSQADNAKGGD